MGLKTWCYRVGFEWCRCVGLWDTSLQLFSLQLWRCLSIQSSSHSVKILMSTKAQLNMPLHFSSRHSMTKTRCKDLLNNAWNLPMLICPVLIVALTELQNSLLHFVVVVDDVVLPMLICSFLLVTFWIVQLPYCIYFRWETLRCWSFLCQ